MEYRNSDFNADKNKQYDAVRTSMAEKYQEVEKSKYENGTVVSWIK